MTVVPSTPRWATEFALYLLRNPDARERVAAKRLEVVEELSKFIVEGIDRLGVILLIPTLGGAHVDHFHQRLRRAWEPTRRR